MPVGICLNHLRSEHSVERCVNPHTIQGAILELEDRINSRVHELEKRVTSLEECVVRGLPGGWAELRSKNKP